MKVFLDEEHVCLKAPNESKQDGRERLWHGFWMHGVEVALGNIGHYYSLDRGPEVLARFTDTVILKIQMKVETRWWAGLRWENEKKRMWRKENEDSTICYFKFITSWTNKDSKSEQTTLEFSNLCISRDYQGRCLGKSATALYHGVFYRKCSCFLNTQSCLPLKSTFHLKKKKDGKK